MAKFATSFSRHFARNETMTNLMGFQGGERFSRLRLQERQDLRLITK